MEPPLAELSLATYRSDSIIIVFSCAGLGVLRPSGSPGSLFSVFSFSISSSKLSTKASSVLSYSGWGVGDTSSR